MTKNLLSSILVTHKLNGNNYPDWFCGLCAILAKVELLYVLGWRPSFVPSDDDESIYHKWREDNDVVKYYMIVSMSSKSAKEYRHKGPLRFGICQKNENASANDDFRTNVFEAKQRDSGP